MANIYANALIPWKGKTFTQITSSFVSNNNVFSDLPVSQLMKANPIKLYRREIASINTLCNPRTSLSIDEFDRPNGSLVYSTNVSVQTNGIPTTLDIGLTENRYERPDNCSSAYITPNAVSLSQNALRRVRGSGFIKKKFDKNNRPNYYGNTAEYLKARNIDFHDNQFNFKSACDLSCNPTNNHPNNDKLKRYYQQGGVTSSAHILRLKQDTINTVAGTMRTSLDSSVADAMAYGVSENPNTNIYTLKAKLGYPLKMTPIVNKYTGQVTKSCSFVQIRGA
jgi:hypothetical protein